MTSNTQLYIDGKWVPSSDGKTFDIINPYSKDVVGTASSASSQDVTAAIEAAGRAFPLWEMISTNERRDIFIRASDLLSTDRYRDLIADATLKETAAPSGWAINNWRGSCNFLRVSAGMVNELKGETFPSAVVPGAQVQTTRRAKGVIFAMAAWNSPIMLTLRAIAVPMIVGNTAILKASELSPRSQALVVQAFEEAGLPPGVLNFVSASRETTPRLTAEIIAHPLVRSVNFTGSDRIGKVIAMEASKYLKPCVLELGGKSPAIVFDDADLQDAANAIIFSNLVYSGQVCMAVGRVLAQKGIAEKLTTTLTEATKKIKAGDPSSNNNHITALFSDGNAESVISKVKGAVDNGAKILLGDLKREGSVLQPHVVHGIRPGMKLWDEETFGPVISIATFDTVDEAIELANQTEYSLHGSVWTKDINTANRVTKDVRSGYLSINGPTIHAEPAVGLVGLGGASGYGRFGIEDFTDKRVIVTHPPGRKYPPFS